MIRSLQILAAALFAGAGLAQEASRAAPPVDVQTLIQRLQEREKGAKSMRLTMQTKGALPGGEEFETRGTMRVLGGTHVHTQMTARFGEDMTAENETVTTPNGVWMRERDPIQGEVFLRIDKELMQQIRRAGETLGESGAVPGTLSNDAAAPFGSAMLADLARAFDLNVEATTIDGEELWVVKGSLRGDVSDEASAALGDADQVEVLVEKSDAAIRRMVQFREGKPFLTVTIHDLQVDVPMNEESFAIALPQGQRWKDVREHVPAWTQIQTLLDDAKALEQERAASQPGAPATQPASDKD